jgi:glutathione peroxidase
MKFLLCSLLLAGMATETSIYDFKVPGLDGKQIDFSSYKGKKIMIVNTASYCGNTPQYADLEKLYENNKEKLVIVGFPANNFGAQEPGTNDEIKTFCKKNYGVSFPMAQKVSVKGDNIHPLFAWLVQQAKTMGTGLSDQDPKKKLYDDPITWNFTKFLLDENGKLIAVFHNRTLVSSDEVTKFFK